MYPQDEMSATDYTLELNRMRQQKDEFFAMSPDSPLPADALGDTFTGLRYFAPDLAFRVDADLVPFDSPRVVMLGTTTGGTQPHLRFGELRFTLHGQDAKLVAFKDADEPDGEELFVPFRDATSGGETYGAGRFLEVDDPDAPAGPHKVIVDFNLAYNPWCAYSESYTCPLPPAENTLALGVKAGEQIFSDEH